MESSSSQLWLWEKDRFNGTLTMARSIPNLKEKGAFGKAQQRGSGPFVMN